MERIYAGFKSQYTERKRSELSLNSIILEAGKSGTGLHLSFSEYGQKIKF